MSALASTHATARAVERYGVHPTDADWLSVAAQIFGDEPGAILLAADMPAGQDGAYVAEKWAVRLCGHAAVVLWVPESARVVTVLGKDGAGNKRPLRSWRVAKRDSARPYRRERGAVEGAE